MLDVGAAANRAINGDQVTTYYLYEITYDPAQEPLRWTSWSSDVSHAGKTYSAKAIKHDEMGVSADGKINDVRVSIGNVDREIQRYIEDYELIGKKVNVIHVFPGFPVTIDATFLIKAASAKKNIVTFTLSLGFDVLNAAIPGRIFRARFCWWRFKDERCKYAGSDAECGYTWEACKAKGNVRNFGGFPGIINDAFYF